ncbi:hypothetical protein GCM10009743_49090 [Kribbella swartbergensis]
MPISARIARNSAIQGCASLGYRSGGAGVAMVVIVSLPFGGPYGVARPPTIMTEGDPGLRGVRSTVAGALSPHRVRVIALMFSAVRATRVDAVRWPWLYA